MILLSVFAGLVATALLLATVSDLVSLSRLASARPKQAVRTTSERSKLLFLIPAHNEEELVAGCVRSVIALRYPRERIGVIVIADNCSDRTAEMARACGAQCLERCDAVHRGKPHAVAWALEQTELATWDAVVILDADAVVDSMYAAELDSAGPLRNKAVECYDDVRNPHDSQLTRMATVFAAGLFRGAFALKRRAGLNIPLSDGMCIGTGVLADHPWQAFGLSEDWETYAILTAAGVTIDLAAGAHLYAQEARSLHQATSQRVRWLTGRLAALKTLGPAVLRSRSVGWHQKLDAIAELVALGPAVQFALCAGLASAVWIGGAPGARACSVALGLSLVRPGVYATVGLYHDRAPVRAAAAFAYLPVYAVWRLAIAVRSMMPFQNREWIRTQRG
jgi:1,2-diacylglycerol 3-beta-glucosyltransferase